MPGVMTLNLNYYGEKFGNWEVRRGLVLEQIQESRPNVITLQAVKKDRMLFDGEDQATQIARLAGYPNVVFQPALKPGDGDAEGSAILSLDTPAGMDFLRLSLLPGTEDTNQRILMNCLFNFPSLTLRIFNAHFSWVPEQASDNMREALEYIRSFPEPFLLLGDLNTQPGSKLFDGFHQAGLVDVWAELCPEETGFTFESDNPQMRIDYVWASPNLKDYLKSIRVVGSQISPNGDRISDHLGLLVELRD